MTKHRFFRSAANSLVLGVAALWLTACGSSDNGGEGSAGSGGASSGSGGAGGSAVATGGSSDGNATGGSTSTGTGGSPGSDASVGGSGGRGSGGSPGSGGGAGASGGGGTGGSRDAGSTGTGGAPRVDAGGQGAGGMRDAGRDAVGGTGGGNPGADGGVRIPGAARSLGFIGCSMAHNVADGYAGVGGMHLWPGYATDGRVVQDWTNTNQANSWGLFDQQKANFGNPTAVWIQICIFAPGFMGPGTGGVTAAEVRQMIANARQHAPGAAIYISGQPLYNMGNVCTLAGAGGPELTDMRAVEAAADATQNVTYLGQFLLPGNQTADTCHANQQGLMTLGNEALTFFGP